MHDTAVCWPLRATPHAEERWAWSPRQLSELASIRRELHGRLVEAAPPPETERDADGQVELHEQLVLSFDELLSNALRHGRAPVGGAVRRIGTAWLLVVSDAAAGAPPHPDPDRDPAQGGLGLRMVADLSADHGWCSDAEHKQVWALLPAG
jgi:two-component sensor histidine kinase